ncbi:hypothetical protein BDV93DRAFT_360931 [Ceratobasidium sp. AG-I]|nr:hypothetical protein BDV93DRAFT_360931 [Ceratobasidium sp. AG-I]
MGLTGQDNPTEIEATTQPSEPAVLSHPLEPGDVVYYLQNNIARECRVEGCGKSRTKGEWFEVLDGPEGEELEERKIDGSEMEDLTRLATRIVKAEF